MLTLGQAAKEIGVSKPTLSKAISTGKLSATRREDQSFAIDPAELMRYHEANKHRFQPATVPALRPETDDNAVEVIELRARADLAEQRLSDLKAQLVDMREQRDKWQDQAQRLALPAPAPTPPAAGFMRWLRRA